MNRLSCDLERRLSVSTARHFTPAEAGRALVLVRRIVADVVREYQRLVEVQEELESPGLGEGEYRRLRERMISAAEKLQTCLQELDDLGVELKDWAAGVVDFPCVAGGREIALCWRHGEGGVGHWHEIVNDCSHRRPIGTLAMETIPAGA